jgi:hypothetical protein
MEVLGSPVHESVAAVPEPIDLDCCLGTTNRAALAAIVLLGGDQPPVPSKQGVWRHQGADLEESFATDGLGLRGEVTTLPISEPQTLSAQLLAKPPVYSEAQPLPPPLGTR